MVQLQFDVICCVPDSILVPLYGTCWLHDVLLLSSFLDQIFIISSPSSLNGLGIRYEMDSSHSKLVMAAGLTVTVYPIPIGTNAVKAPPSLPYSIICTKEPHNVGLGFSLHRYNRASIVRVRQFKLINFN